MDRLIDVVSVVLFISMIIYAAIKLDEAARRLRDEEEKLNNDTIVALDVVIKELKLGSKKIEELKK